MTMAVKGSRQTHQVQMDPLGNDDSWQGILKGGNESNTYLSAHVKSRVRFFPILKFKEGNLTVLRQGSNHHCNCTYAYAIGCVNALYSNTHIFAAMWLTAMCITACFNQNKMVPWFKAKTHNPSMWKSNQTKSSPLENETQTIKGLHAHVYCWGVGDMQQCDAMTFAFVDANILVLNYGYFSRKTSKWYG